MSLVETKSLFSPVEMSTRGGRPLINQLQYSSYISVFDARNNDIRTLMDWVKRSPEPLGIVNKISSDVATSVSFRPVEKKNLRGRPSKDEDKSRVDKAKLFARANFFRSLVKESVADCVITGDFFNWKGKVSRSQLKEVVKDVYSKYGFELKEYDIKQYFDEDFSGVNALQHVASTTVTIDFDSEKVKGYVQRVYEYVGTLEPRRWGAEEIIHGTFMRLDGKVYGYTPMTANRAVISTLGLIKDYAGNYFKGGGAPDLLIAFEQNLDSGTRQLIEQQFQEYKDNTRRGHMFVDGSKISVDKINEFNKDMEFHKLAIYYTGVLAVSFRMPTSYMGPVIGAIVKQSSGGADSTEGDYWRNIRSFQEYLEDLYNTQLWIPEFGVEMRFDKPYLIDEIKESQNQMFVNDALAKTNFMLNRYGKQLKVETLLRLLGFEESDLEEMSDEQKAAMAGNSFGQEFTPGNRQNQQDNLSLKRGESTESARDQKRSQARPEKATASQVS